MTRTAALLTAYVGLELRRTYRDPGFMIFGLGTPVLMYVLFTSIGRGDGPADPGWAVVSMVGLAAYGALGSGLSAGTAVAEDKGTGWLRLLRLLPMRPWTVVAGRALTGSLMVLPSVLLVLATGALLNGVRLEAWQWAVLPLLLWIGALPFVLLGIANGYRLSPSAAGTTNIVVNLLLALLGGLWFPLSEFPGALADLAAWSPGHLFGALGWATVDGAAPSPGTVAGLLGWTLVFGAYAVHSFLRPATKG
ncbi:ABC transporter permease [Nocardiopsis changdeensis]|uniref:ABC transporter permease n=1 Tax=Nocardiopsis changdeensis TaxID=2831969 RepID=A0ABX8BR26_9ACTN|nr:MULTISPECIES: ABC transporter permease [Nocardiopsis]QUX23301.1 ABC transporter permease [Nocardiopsis changdeensis]QYX39243.1 ABC transporter permease [Nocardiopsis sp. MT53]